jgi:hypothetical protein
VSSDATLGWLRSLDAADPEEQWPVLCFLAGQDVEVAEEERNAALRRAELLLAAGGDPRRSLELYGRATSAVAADLDSLERRAQLRAGLERLQDQAAGLPGTGEAIRVLLGDPDLAWQSFAMALLAEELGDSESAQGPDPEGV